MSDARNFTIAAMLLSLVGMAFFGLGEHGKIDITFPLLVLISALATSVIEEWVK